MYIAETQLRVRYAETDQMGYVYYGHYAAYYEVGRVEALRKLGFSYRQLEDMGIMMPVLESKIRYLKPARYDELLTIKVIIPVMPAVKMNFTYEITNEKKELINKGETTLVFIDMAKNKPRRLPEIMKTLFEPYFIE